MGVIHRKMNQHEEAAKWFSKAKILNNDEKNVVGDQPLSEQVLSQFKFPAAAARRSVTLEGIEEMPSPQSCFSSDGTTPQASRFSNCFCESECSHVNLYTVCQLSPVETSLDDVRTPDDYEISNLSEGFSASYSSCSTNSDLSSRERRSPYGMPAEDEEEVAKRLDLSLQIEMDTPRIRKVHDQAIEVKCDIDLAPTDGMLLVDDRLCVNQCVLADEKLPSENTTDREQSEDEERQYQEEERKQMQREIAAANKEEEQIALNLAAVAALRKEDHMVMPTVQTRDLPLSDCKDEQQDIVSRTGAGGSEMDELFSGCIEEQNAVSGALETAASEESVAIFHEELSHTDASDEQVQKVEIFAFERKQVLIQSCCSSPILFSKSLTL